MGWTIKDSGFRATVTLKSATSLYMLSLSTELKMRQRPSETKKLRAHAAHASRRLIQFITAASILLLAAGCDERPPRPIANAVAHSADDVQPLAVGEQAQEFMVRAVDGSAVTLAPGKTDRPLLLITFRGGWCPYCNLQLSELRNVIPELRDAGVDVAFLSGDRPDLLFDSLSLETQDDIAALDYTIYSDAEGHGATALGIAFHATDQTIKRRREKEQDIDGSSMDRLGILAVPSVFVFDTSGVVRFVYANADYKIRLPANEVRDAALAAVTPADK
jgi:peroxiredoxin